MQMPGFGKDCVASELSALADGAMALLQREMWIRTSVGNRTPTQPCSEPLPLLQPTGARRLCCQY